MAQLAGGLAGALLILATFAGAAEMGTGSTALADGVSFGGPLIGGAIAAFAYDAIARPRLVEAEPPQGTEGDIRGRRRPPEAAAAGRQGTGRDVAGRRR